MALFRCGTGAQITGIDPGEILKPDGTITTNTYTSSSGLNAICAINTKGYSTLTVSCNSGGSFYDTVYGIQANGEIVVLANISQTHSHDVSNVDFIYVTTLSSIAGTFTIAIS